MQGDLFDVAAAFAGLVAAGVVDQDLAHQVGRDAEEVGAAFPFDAGLVYEAEIGFMDEGGGAEGVFLAFIAHVGAGEPAQFGIDQGQEGIDSGVISCGEVHQKAGDIRRFGHKRFPYK